MATHNVYEYISKHQGCNVDEIARELNLAKHSIELSIRTLKRTMTKNGNPFIYTKENKLYARKWED